MLICTVQLTVCSYHVTYASHSEFTLSICLDVTELLAWSKRDIWNLTVFIGTRIQKDLVHKQTLNYLAKLTKYLSWFESTYLFSAFDCMFLSCHVRISVWIHTLYLPECQELLARNRCDVWSLTGCNGTRTQNHFLWKQTLNHLATDEMIDLSWEFLSVRCIWLYVLIMWCACFRVNSHSIFSLMSKNFLLKTGVISKV